MTTPEPLKALRERVESATGADREIDADLHLLLGQVPNEHYKQPWRRPILLANEHRRPGLLEYVEISGVSARAAPYYTSSIDTALTLAARVNASAAPCVGQNVHHGHWHARLSKVGDGDGPFTVGEANAPTPALALLSALLKSMEQDNG